MAEDGDLVLPGDQLGFSEEYLGGPGTYEGEGMIYAAVVGKMQMDSKERKISVDIKANKIPQIKDGDTIIGVIHDIKTQFITVEILKIVGEKRNLPGYVSGSIHISQARDTYVSDLEREFGVGDVVIAKVTNANRSPISLTTAPKEMGVMKGNCLKCNLPLEIVDKKLKCSNCGRTLTRKLSTDFGKGYLE